MTGYDIISTKGVEYVTVDASYLYDNSALPEITPEDDKDDFYWLGGN